MAWTKKQQRAYMVEYSKRNRERLRAYRREWRAGKGKGKEASGRKRWRQANARRVKSYMQQRSLKKLYGITQVDYDKKLAEQEGRCAVCRREPDTTKRRLHVDHDHDTGVIRGILCHGCNTGLGAFQDDAVILEQARHYLKRHKISQVDEHRRKLGLGDYNG